MPAGAKGVGLPGVGVTGGCEVRDDEAAGTQTRVP